MDAELVYSRLAATVYSLDLFLGILSNAQFDPPALAIAVSVGMQLQTARVQTAVFMFCFTLCAA